MGKVVEGGRVVVGEKRDPPLRPLSTGLILTGGMLFLAGVGFLIGYLSRPRTSWSPSLNEDRRVYVEAEDVLGGVTDKSVYHYHALDNCARRTRFDYLMTIRAAQDSGYVQCEECSGPVMWDPPLKEQWLGSAWTLIGVGVALSIAGSGVVAWRRSHCPRCGSRSVGRFCGRCGGKLSTKG